MIGRPAGSAYHAPPEAEHDVSFACINRARGWLTWQAGCGDTRGVAEESCAFLEPRRRRLPAGLEAAGEEFVRSRFGWPDGDRRDDAESGHAERRPLAAQAERDQHIVREFVLRDHVE